MPITPPRLDDRSFDDLVAELVARIPAHTPEWTHVQPGDPGRTLIELFAWLGDTLLYRANLIPERQRLAFLRLLGIPLRPARAARAVVGIHHSREGVTDALYLPAGTGVVGPLPFETRGELSVLPVVGPATIKRTLTASEKSHLSEVIAALADLYEVPAATPYATSPVFIDGQAEPAGLDLVTATVDQTLWFPLLALPGAAVDAVRTTLTSGAAGRPHILSVGVVPALAVPDDFDEAPERVRLPHVWEVTTGRVLDGKPEYAVLDVVQDGTQGLLRDGVVRLLLPAGRLGAPPEPAPGVLSAGLGDAPPRLDDPAVAARLVAWLRLRPTEPVNRLALTWAGLNAVVVDQRRTLYNRVVGQSDGTADQVLQLPVSSVESDTLVVEVEEPGRGFLPWQVTGDLALAGRDDAVFSLDAEAGTLRFGDGVRGRIPERTMRVRAVRLRAGGGLAGNLPPGSLTGVDGRPLKVVQALPTRGGVDAERVEDAELRIPTVLRHGERAVTEVDFRTLAASTPGVRLGRVEVLPRFKPHQRRTDVPGVLSVMVLPYLDTFQPPNPRPDRLTIEAVHAWLEPRRVLGTELYVIGTEYVPVGVAVSVIIRDGHERDATLQAVRDAVRVFLWPLAPGGLDGAGWRLGASVTEGEIEVAVSRVAGVRSVGGIALFAVAGDRFVTPTGGRPGEVVLRPWQLPELLAVVADVGTSRPTRMDGPPHVATGQGVPVPVVPEVC